MRVRASGPHLGGDPDRLHDLLLAGALALSQPRVAADAVRALRHMRDSDRDELLGLLRQRSVGEDLPAEFLKRVVDLRRELRPAGRELGRGWGIQRVWHVRPPGRVR